MKIMRYLKKFCCELKRLKVIIKVKNSYGRVTNLKVSDSNIQKIIGQLQFIGLNSLRTNSFRPIGFSLADMKTCFVCNRDERSIIIKRCSNFDTCTAQLAPQAYSTVPFPYQLNHRKINRFWRFWPFGSKSEEKGNVFIKNLHLIEKMSFIMILDRHTQRPWSKFCYQYD